MAEITDCKPENVAGRFYVDASCIDCDMCRESASFAFRRDDDTGQSFVYRQPSTPDEIAQARDTLDACPTSSIGEREETDATA